MTARDDTLDAARRLRTVIEECERIAADDTDPRQEQAYRWLNRLIGADLLSGYPSRSITAADGGRQRHTPGAHLALATQAELEGWPKHKSRL